MADDMSFVYPASSGGVSSGSGSSSSQQSTQMVPGMMGVYQQLLGMNQQNYGNVMNAYNTGQNRAASQLPGVYGGYDTLQGQVNNTLGMGAVLGQNGNYGIAQPAVNDLNRAYAQQQGATTQQMANAGLGNTTAAAQAQQQNTFNYGQSLTNIGAQLAGTAAQYQSQIGQSGLASRMQGLGLQTGLTQAALGPLGQQFSNTAGSLTGGFGQSQSTNTQQSQQGSQGGGQSGGGGSGAGAAGGLPAGVPGGPAGGGYAAGGGGGGSGAGVAGVAPYGGGTGTAYDSSNPYAPAVGKGPGAPTTVTANNDLASNKPYGPTDSPNGPSASAKDSGDSSVASGKDASATDAAAAGTAKGDGMTPAVAKQYGADVIDPKAGPPPYPGAKPLISLRGAPNDSRIVTKVITGWQ